MRSNTLLKYKLPTKRGISAIETLHEIRTYSVLSEEGLVLSVRRDNSKEEKERVKLFLSNVLQQHRNLEIPSIEFESSKNCDSVQIDGLGVDVDGMYTEEMQRLKVNQVKNLFLSKKRKKERLEENFPSFRTRTPRADILR